MSAKNDPYSDAEHERVNQAIQKAEALTSAEIMPVVARCSGRYDRPEDMVGLWFAALAMVVVWWIYPIPTVDSGNWEATAPGWQLVAILFGTIVGFVVGAIAGSKIDWLRRLFTPQVQMNEEVYNKARQVFFDSRIHHTEGGTGVLLYVSLFERKASVIADQSVIEKLGQDRIDVLCVEFTERLHNGTVVDALCETAVALGESLETALPRAEDDVNELPDAMVYID